MQGDTNNKAKSWNLENEKLRLGRRVDVWPRDLERGYLQLDCRIEFIIQLFVVHPFSAWENVCYPGPQIWLSFYIA